MREKVVGNKDGEAAKRSDHGKSYRPLQRFCLLIWVAVEIHWKAWGRKEI